MNDLQPRAATGGRSNRATGFRARRSRLHAGAAALVLLAGGTLFSPERARAQNSPEELILEVSRARDLAVLALEDLVGPVGLMLLRIGPSSAFASDPRGLGHGSLTFGAVAGALTLTSPDYTDADPTGGDRIDAAVGSVNTDITIGLASGRAIGRLEGVGSVDVLLRLGYTLGDQDDIADNVDVGSLKSILGAGLRIGVLKGEGLPAVSLAGGFNVLRRRTFNVRGTASNNGATKLFVIALELEQTTAFAMAEIAKRLGFVTPFAAFGVAGHTFESHYDSEVVYDATSNSVIVSVVVEIKRTSGIALAGLEFGAGPAGIVLEGGTAGGEAFGAFYIRFRR